MNFDKAVDRAFPAVRLNAAMPDQLQITVISWDVSYMEPFENANFARPLTPYPQASTPAPSTRPTSELTIEPNGSPALRARYRLEFQGRTGMSHEPNQFEPGWNAAAGVWVGRRVSEGEFD